MAALLDSEQQRGARYLLCAETTLFFNRLAPLGQFTPVIGEWIYTNQRP
jgi:hypothetical protein